VLVGLAAAGYTPSHAGVIQLVECQLPKLDVVGSSPIARSSYITMPCSELRCRALCIAGFPGGDLRSAPRGMRSNDDSSSCGHRTVHGRESTVVGRNHAHTVHNLTPNAIEHLGTRHSGHHLSV
jgi:hypothetical protein